MWKHFIQFSDGLFWIKRHLLWVNWWFGFRVLGIQEYPKVSPKHQSKITNRIFEKRLLACTNSHLSIQTCSCWEEILLGMYQNPPKKWDFTWVAHWISSIITLFSVMSDRKKRQGIVKVLELVAMTFVENLRFVFVSWFQPPGAVSNICHPWIQSRKRSHVARYVTFTSKRMDFSNMSRFTEELIN